MKNNSSSNAPTFYPAALTIAGSDSSGGAGIQADMRTFNAFAVYPCSVITAITAQNPHRVIGIQGIDPEIVAKQLDAVLSEVAIPYAKSGMLFQAAIVHEVALAVKKYRLKLVVDPVMVSTSGAVLLENSAIEAMRKELLPLAAWITPNLPEAELLLDRKIKSEREMFDSAKMLAEMFKTNIVLKGGHLNSKQAVDAVILNNRAYRLTSPMLKNCRHSHGTGCTFSAALCANLGLGISPEEAIVEAKTFVFGSLAEPVRIGENVEVMYPPELDYSEQITLQEI